MHVLERPTGLPAVLRDLPHAPERLYALGDPSVLDSAPARLVAIVGTRDATSYGVRVASALARAFAEAGIGVVSGMARGVDSAAHLGALDAGGTTIAVLGTGVDVPYPVGNRALHGAIAERGLVLSEQEPGTLAFRGCFPRRNRLIAALARLTIVVEAPYKSGAINTATQALELGRTVAAVPGPIDSPRSAGCNLLLRDGAQVISTVEDALGLMGIARRERAARPDIEPADRRVWDALADGSSSIERIVTLARLPVRQVIESVARLELCGLVQQEMGGDVVRYPID